MKCSECKLWNAEDNICNASPNELTEVVCLLRCILWVMLVNQRDDEEGEWR